MASSYLAEQLEQQLHDIEFELFELNEVIEEFTKKYVQEEDSEKKLALLTKINTQTEKYKSLVFLLNVTQTALNKEMEFDAGPHDYFEVTESAADY
jgi:predicted nucleic acid-binding protein